MNAKEILSALESLRAPALPGEYDLHRLIAQTLVNAQIPFTHEAPLSPRRRIDFLVGTIGIEVKKGRPNARALTSQLARYLESERVSEVIVITQRAVSLPGNIHNKRVTILSLNRLWGVALP